MSGTGRLPTLKNNADGKPKPTLKFKPKAIARRSKEEREASAPMLTSEDVIGKKKYDKRGNNQGNKSCLLYTSRCV